MSIQSHASLIGKQEMEASPEPKEAGLMGSRRAGAQNGPPLESHTKPCRYIHAVSLTCLSCTCTWREYCRDTSDQGQLSIEARSL